MLEFLVGSSLAAAAGLNDWMPLFELGMVDRVLPGFERPAGWAWLSSDAALWIVGVLLVVEIVADKIPAVDSINDVIQTVIRPASGGIAFGAGASAEAATDPTHLFENGAWVPIAVGIVIARAQQPAKATVRPVANRATAGIAAPALSTAEDLSSFALAITAVVVPIVAAVLLVGLIVMIIALLRRRRRLSKAAQPRA